MALMKRGIHMRFNRELVRLGLARGKDCWISLAYAEGDAPACGHVYWLAGDGLQPGLQPSWVENANHRGCRVVCERPPMRTADGWMCKAASMQGAALRCPSGMGALPGNSILWAGSKAEQGAWNG